MLSSDVSQLCFVCLCVQLICICADKHECLDVFVCVCASVSACDCVCTNAKLWLSTCFGHRADMYVCKSTFAYLLYHPSLLRCACLSVCPQLCISVYIGMYVCMCMYVSELCTLRCQKRGRLGVYFLSLSLCVPVRSSQCLLSQEKSVSISHLSSSQKCVTLSGLWTRQTTTMCPLSRTDICSVSHRLKVWEIAWKKVLEEDFTLYLHSHCGSWHIMLWANDGWQTPNCNLL